MLLHSFDVLRLQRVEKQKILYKKLLVLLISDAALHIPTQYKVISTLGVEHAKG